MRNREAILEAVAAASHFLQDHWDDHTRPLDLIQVVRDLEVPLLFRPMKNLLGATICPDEDACGILITSERPRTVQRFTLAHEIGHVILGHKMKFDTNETMVFRGGVDHRPIEEQTADHFAAHILAPRPLLAHLASRQKWMKADLQKPRIIYQLALRLGLSFAATCIALENHRVIPRSLADALREKQGLVKSIKKEWLKDHKIANFYGDVWWLTNGDIDTQIEAAPDDIFLIPVEENGGAGFRWTGLLDGQQMGIHSYGEPPSIFGARQSRRLVIDELEAGNHSIELIHSRPWNNDVLESKRLAIENWGKEKPGLPRAQKLEVLSSEVT